MKKSIFLVFTYFFYSSVAQCTLDFANQDATLIIDELSQVTVSRLKLTNASQVTGWTQDSIIKSFVKSAASWTETYTAGVELGTGRRQPSTNMVVNNSNAINFLVPTMNLNKNNSNTIASIAPLAQANSNLIAALARLELSNSNTIVTLPVRVRSNSNTLLRLIRSDSNAIISLNFRVRANSNAAVALSRRVVNNSNAINNLASASTTLTTLVRNNSNAIVFVRNQVAPLNIQNSNAINFIGNTVQIVSNHSRFQATTTINKLILYKAGISVDAGKTLTLMTPLPVNGNIALNTTGKIALAGDLYLGSNAYITSGGYVAGNNLSLVMSDSLVLSTLTTLQITSSLIIDGNGGTLVFGPHAQLLVESNVSLTLKNLNIQTTRNSPNIPIIRCFDQKGHVTLDNVKLALADDFPFTTGRMFCFNDVRFTGTSRFIYQSVMQSYVAPQSLLTFDPGTTLYYYPSSTDKDLIQPQDKSAGIYLKGSATTLQTTHTGMRLSKGRFWLDNKVTLSTRAATVANGFVQLTTASYGTRVKSVDWSPDGKYLAVGGFGPTNGNEFQIYRFNGATLTYVTGDDWAGGGAEVWRVRWHPSGRFVAAVGDATNDVRIYSFNDTTLTTLDVTDLTTIGEVRGLAWSPAGDYLLFGIANDEASDELRLYRFTGSKLVFVTSRNNGTVVGSARVNSCSWHPGGVMFPNGALFTMTGNQGPGVNETFLFRFDGNTITLLNQQNLGTDGVSVEFSPEGLFFAHTLTRSSSSSLSVVLVNGVSSVSNLVTIGYSTTPISLLEARWSPDGQYIVAGGTLPDDGNELKLYKFTRPATLTQVASYNYGTSINGVAWSRDGKYIAIGGEGPDGGHDELEVWTVSYRFDTTTQALTNGLVFGNSAQGSSSDLDVYLLAGARVELNGKLFYNNVS
ncbi:WD40 repeat domain-containing protein [Candidatus Babeliales bacterium]|nr:WD40 repeat domain-containing protein [Candidatus Babeliales bacterium]